MKITLSTIIHHPLNKTFFDNAHLHGDEGYHFNAARRELTVKMRLGHLEREATWRVSTDGEILEVIN